MKTKEQIEKELKKFEELTETKQNMSRKELLVHVESILVKLSAIHERAQAIINNTQKTKDNKDLLKLLDRVSLQTYKLSYDEKRFPLETKLEASKARSEIIEDGTITKEEYEKIFNW